MTAETEDEAFLLALFDASQNLLRIRQESVACFIQSALEKDEAPDPAILANIIGTSIDTLRMEYNRCVYARTGKIVQKSDAGLQ
jgi:hypothetical protein